MSDSLTSAEADPVSAQSVGSDTPSPPPVTVDELSEDEADELRERKSRPMTLEEVAIEFADLHRRFKRGRIDQTRAYAHTNILNGARQAAKDLEERAIKREEIAEMRRLGDAIERAEAQANGRLPGRTDADDFTDEELAAIARRGRPVLESPSDSSSENEL